MIFSGDYITDWGYRLYFVSLSVDFIEQVTTDIDLETLIPNQLKEFYKPSIESPCAFPKGYRKRQIIANVGTNINVYFDIPIKPDTFEFRRMIDEFNADINILSFRTVGEKVPDHYLMKFF